MWGKIVIFFCGGAGALVRGRVTWGVAVRIKSNMGLCFAGALSRCHPMVRGKRGGLLCLREHAIHVFTSRPQKHQPQWNYSPPGMKDIRFYGTRTSQKIKSQFAARNVGRAAYRLFQTLLYEPGTATVSEFFSGRAFNASDCMLPPVPQAASFPPYTVSRRLNEAIKHYPIVFGP